MVVTKSPRRRKWYGLASAIFSLFIGVVPAYIGADFLLSFLQKNFFCESEAFLCGPTQLGHIIFVMPWVFIGIPLGFLMTNVIELIIRSFNPANVAEFWKHSRGIIKFLGWMSAIMVPISLIALPSYFSVSPTTIVFKKAIWSERKLYTWDNVNHVVTECLHVRRMGKNRSTNRDSYELIMHDGEAIDLADRPRDFINAYPLISSALHGKNFSFNSHGTCPKELRALFLNRP